MDRPREDRSLIDAYIIPALNLSIYPTLPMINETYGDSSPRLLAHPVLE